LNPKGIEKFIENLDYWVLQIIYIITSVNRQSKIVLYPLKTHKAKIVFFLDFL